jgi:hypothetical protein
MNVPDELHKRLKHYCVEVETDMTTLVLRLIEDFLKKAEGKLKKQ